MFPDIEIALDKGSNCHYDRRYLCVIQAHGSHGWVDVLTCDERDTLTVVKHKAFALRDAAYKWMPNTPQEKRQVRIVTNFVRLHKKNPPEASWPQLVSDASVQDQLVVPESHRTAAAWRQLHDELRDKKVAMEEEGIQVTEAYAAEPWGEFMRELGMDPMKSTVNERRMALHASHQLELAREVITRLEGSGTGEATT